VTSVQHAIADYIHEIARWRRRKLDEYQADPRNLRAATGLEELAAYVLTLPDDDARVRELGRLAMQGELFQPGQQTSYEIGRFRYHYPDTNLDAFVTRMAELAWNDASEHGRFAGLTPEGDDPFSRPTGESTR
jgi:hypothetical protein